MADQTDLPFDVVFSDDPASTDIRHTAALAPNDLAAVIAATTGARAGSHISAEPNQPRFDGDTSQLPPLVCWTLQELVAAPHVRQGTGRHWAVLLQYEELLRSRLSELGLVLEINREHGYAFTRQGDDPSPHARTLLRARTLSLSASALALYLYNQYLLAPDDPVVETADMIEHMLGYKPSDDTDEAGFVRRMYAAIRALDEAHIIKPVPGTSRYLIYGVITSLLSAERVEALTARYTAIAASREIAGGPGDRHPADNAATDLEADEGRDDD
jgi:Domain of unknown function (DUF4194)